MGGMISYICLGVGALVFLGSMLVLVIVVALKFRARAAQSQSQPQQPALRPIPAGGFYVHPNPTPNQANMLDLVEALVLDGEKRRRREKIEGSLYDTYSAGPKA